MESHPGFITPTENNFASISSLVPATTGRLVVKYSHKRKSSQDPNVSQEFYSESQKNFTTHREIRDFF